MTTKAKTEAVPDNGETAFIPLNKLKKHPKNARKTPHSEASIEAKAASIAAKGILQNLVVEPERDSEGEPTGCYLVSIGEAITSCDAESHFLDRSRCPLKPIRIRNSKYLNHRRVKRRIRSMLGFKSTAIAEIVLSSIEMIHMTRKRQARFAYNPRPSIAEQFEMLAA